MIKSIRLGVLQIPTSTLVLHYGEHSTAQSFRPCEFAFVGNVDKNMCISSNQLSVTVLVSRSNFPALKSRYTQIPGVTVQPFLIEPAELTAGMMLALMGVSKGKTPPLYINQVTRILRQMNSESASGFCYQTFRRRLKETPFDGIQCEHLNQRLDLLESFIDLSGKSTATTFVSGQVTILDLSCPFVDENTACLLFNIGMGRFMESCSSRGKLLVLDEAHKVRIHCKRGTLGNYLFGKLIVNCFSSCVTHPPQRSSRSSFCRSSDSRDTMVSVSLSRPRSHISRRGSSTSAP